MSKRIVVAEEIADAGLDRLRSAGFIVDVQLNKTATELHAILDGAHALIVRSATMVDAAMLAAGKQLVVVARAGVGLDNIDVEAATKQGVMVVNAPQSNVLSAAEHTMALILSIARNVPQAHSALTAGVGSAASGKVSNLLVKRSASWVSAASERWLPNALALSTCDLLPTTHTFRPSAAANWALK